jgi:hypothetical protein
MPNDDALYYTAALYRLAERHRWSQILEATAALAWAVDDRDYPAIQQACAALRAAFAESLSGPEPARQVAAVAWRRLLGCLVPA